MDIPAVGSVHLFVSGRGFYRGRAALPVGAFFVASMVGLGRAATGFLAGFVIA